MCARFTSLEVLSPNSQQWSDKEKDDNVNLHRPCRTQPVNQLILVNCPIINVSCMRLMRIKIFTCTLIRIAHRSANAMRIIGMNSWIRNRMAIPNWYKCLSRGDILDRTSGEGLSSSLIVCFQLVCYHKIWCTFHCWILIKVSAGCRKTK